MKKHNKDRYTISRSDIWGLRIIYTLGFIALSMVSIYLGRWYDYLGCFIAGVLMVYYWHK